MFTLSKFMFHSQVLVTSHDTNIYLKVMKMMFKFSFLIVYLLLVIDSNLANKQAISFQGKKMKAKQNRQKHMDTRAYEFS